MKPIVALIGGCDRGVSLENAPDRLGKFQVLKDLNPIDSTGVEHGRPGDERVGGACQGVHAGHPRRLIVPLALQAMVISDIYQQNVSLIRWFLRRAAAKVIEASPRCPRNPVFLWFASTFFNQTPAAFAAGMAAGQFRQ